MLYDTWIAENNRMRRNIAIDITVRGYQHIVTYRNIAYYRGIYAYPHAIAYDRSTFSFSPVFTSDSNAFVYITVTSDSCIRINCNTIRMADI